MDFKISVYLKKLMNDTSSDLQISVYKQIFKKNKPKTLSESKSHRDILEKIYSDSMWEQPNPFALIYLYRCSHENDENIRSQNVINHYLRFLTHPSPRLDFYFKIFNQILEQKNGRENHKPITTEKEVYRTVAIAIKKDIWEKELQLSKNAEDENHKDATKQFKDLLNYRLNLIAEWFLRRYNIFAAFKTYRLGKLYSDNKDKIDIELPTNYKPIIFLAVLLVMFSSFAFVAIGILGFKWFSVLISGLLIPLLILIPFQYSISRNHSIIRLIIPRQLGAIVAGYFLLIIVGSEYWDFLVNLIEAANNISQVFLFFIPGSLLLLILFYLFWEVRNQLGYFSSKEGVWRRVFPVFILGLIETIVIGSVFFNLTGCYLQSLFLQHKNFLNSGPLCLEQMTFIATYIALALFVGIFLQIFWQDEPITVSL